MPRDIDQILTRLEGAIRDVQIRQLQVSHAADDDGLWYISISGKPGEVQIESANGTCPFLIESIFNDARHTGSTVDEVVALVRSLLA
jgi:hypothetical protein